VGIVVEGQVLARWPIRRCLGIPDGCRWASKVPTYLEPSWRDGRARKVVPFGLRRVKAPAGLTDTRRKVWVSSTLVGCDFNPYGRKGCPGPVWLIAEVRTRYLKSCYAADALVNTGNLDE
jgi:hypothetical protein